MSARGAGGQGDRGGRRISKGGGGIWKSTRKKVNTITYLIHFTVHCHDIQIKRLLIMSSQQSRLITDGISTFACASVVFTCCVVFVFCVCLFSCVFVVDGFFACRRGITPPPSINLNGADF